MTPTLDAALDKVVDTFLRLQVRTEITRALLQLELLAIQREHDTANSSTHLPRFDQLLFCHVHHSSHSFRVVNHHSHAVRTRQLPPAA